MRRIDEDTRYALDGSRPADTLTVWAWRAGKLVLPYPLELADWSFQDAAEESTKIGQRLTLTVADPDGTLGAWRFDDPLAVGGTRLQIIYNVGGSGTVNYGWYRITGNTPTEYRESRIIDEYGYSEPDGSLPEHKRRVWITSSQVVLQLEDLTGDVDRDKFLYPHSPATGATVVSEFKRMTKDYFPTVVDAGVVDRSVSRQTVYDRERLDSCQDLLTRISARYRMGGDGEAHIYPRVGSVVWRVEPTKGLMEVGRTQSIDGLYNRWVVEGKNAATGDPLYGTVDLTYGPLRYGGPHGRVQYSYASEMINTVAEATTYAATLRDEFLASLAVTLQVTTLPRPELQAGDRIEVGYPTAAGHVAYLPGEITGLRFSGAPIPKPMQLTVKCSYSDVVAALDRTPWAQYLTDTLPPLTWALMPGSWGQLPDMTWKELP